MTRHIYTIGHYVEVEGRNKTEARARAIAAAELMLTGTYRPDVAEWRGVTMFVYRTPFGWHYLLGDSACEHGSWETRQEAREHAARHAAQMAFNPRTGADDIHEWATEEDARDHASWCLWQRRYARAIDAGADHHQARAIADGRVSA